MRIKILPDPEQPIPVVQPQPTEVYQTPVSAFPASRFGIVDYNDLKFAALDARAIISIGFCIALFVAFIVYAVGWCVGRYRRRRFLAAHKPITAKANTQETDAVAKAQAVLADGFKAAFEAGLKSTEVISTPAPATTTTQAQ